MSLPHEERSPGRRLTSTADRAARDAVDEAAPRITARPAPIASCDAGQDFLSISPDLAMATALKVIEPATVAVVSVSP